MKATLCQPAMHLDPAKLIAADECCPICRSPAPRRPAAVIQQAPPAYFFSCPNCLGCSASAAGMVRSASHSPANSSIKPRSTSSISLWLIIKLPAHSIPTSDLQFRTNGIWSE
ncbi:hypothetical protein [Pedosphaera parvula]|uniref:hypothetical protein n=1 Tax=Pedosphaera parvula TaxID=1032527 RepID=UPI001237107E|nr:hypothetical protein [Pedosphaera parvula]